MENLSENIKGKVSYSLLDQLQRAALSISLNIAEGNGRFHKKEKLNFFYISRGSIFECVPIIQVLRSKNLLSEKEYQNLYSKLEILSKMISGLINSIEKDWQSNSVFIFPPKRQRSIYYCSFSRTFLFLGEWRIVNCPPEADLPPADELIKG